MLWESPDRLHGVAKRLAVLLRLPRSKQSTCTAPDNTQRSSSMLVVRNGQAPRLAQAATAVACNAAVELLPALRSTVHDGSSPTHLQAAAPLLPLGGGDGGRLPPPAAAQQQAGGSSSTRRGSRLVAAAAAQLRAYANTGQRRRSLHVSVVRAAGSTSDSSSSEEDDEEEGRPLTYAEWRKDWQPQSAELVLQAGGVLARETSAILDYLQTRVRAAAAWPALGAAAMPAPPAVACAALNPRTPRGGPPPRRRWACLRRKRSIFWIASQTAACRSTRRVAVLWPPRCGRPRGPDPDPHPAADGVRLPVPAPRLRAHARPCNPPPFGSSCSATRCARRGQSLWHATSVQWWSTLLRSCGAWTCHAA